MLVYGIVLGWLGVWTPELPLAVSRAGQNSANVVLFLSGLGLEVGEHSLLGSHFTLHLLSFIIPFFVGQWGNSFGSWCQAHSMIRGDWEGQHNATNMDWVWTAKCCSLPSSLVTAWFTSSVWFRPSPSRELSDKRPHQRTWDHSGVDLCNQECKMGCLF